MSKIVVKGEAGTPMGSYSVYYYRVGRDGSVTEEKGYDRDVNVDYVERLEPRANEIAQAVCESHGSRPETLVFGSERAQQAWQESQNAADK